MNFSVQILSFKIRYSIKKDWLHVFNSVWNHFKPVVVKLIKDIVSLGFKNSSYNNLVYMLSLKRILNCNKKNERNQYDLNDHQIVYNKPAYILCKNVRTHLIAV